jgi:integrase
MARIMKLDTRTARTRLERDQMHWGRLAPNLALGYRRGASAPCGVWTVKISKPKRSETRLGAADDAVEADGSLVLSYGDAVARAWKMFRDASGVVFGRLTVRELAELYLADFDARGRKSRKGTEIALNAHILPHLGDRDISTLTTSTIREWQARVAASPPRLRTALGQAQKYREIDGSSDAARARRSTANRTLTIIKAMLNFAFNTSRIGSDAAWRAVKPFAAVERARGRYLSIDEAKRLVRACDPDFVRMVQGAFFTGARYQELARLTVADFNAEAGILNIRRAKAGPRHVFLSPEAVQYFRSVVGKRSADHLIFLREDGTAWGKSHQHRRMADACKAAGIKTITFHELRHAHASWLVAAGAPMPVVAVALGHTDSRMVEKFYSHLAPDHVSNAIRAAVPNLGFKPRRAKSTVST